MKIVLATNSDKEEIFRLYRSQLGRECCAWTEDYPGMQEIEFDISRNSLFVMKDDNNSIIATVSIDDDKEVEKLECWSKELAPGAELSRLAVSVEYQNRGIAKEMLSFGMKELSRRGFKSVHFLVNKNNKKAIRSYERFKFNNVGDTTLFSQPFWCYEKPLRSAFRVGIMGTGIIANAMATAVTGLQGDYVLYAVASRTLQKAEEFAKKWNIEKAYGSYEEMAQDPEIDLVYVASPHSAHYENAKLCLENGRNVLVEKAFTANAGQAKELIAMSEQKGLFLGEAIWTRFQPSVEIIRSILNSGELGTVSHMEADFSVPISHIQRMYDPALCGGALLDLGMYALTTADLYFGNQIVESRSKAELYETGVDATDEIYYRYADGRTALLKTSFLNPISNYAVIEGSKAKLTWLDLNNPREIRVQNLKGETVKKVDVPKQINGYEYELIAARKAIEEGAVECPEMPHGKTLEIMEIMDGLRRDWGVVYPYD